MGAGNRHQRAAQPGWQCTALSSAPALILICFFPPDPSARPSHHPLPAATPPMRCRRTTRCCRCRCGATRGCWWPWRSAWACTPSSCTSPSWPTSSPSCRCLSTSGCWCWPTPCPSSCWRRRVGAGGRGPRQGQVQEGRAYKSGPQVPWPGPRLQMNRFVRPHVHTGSRRRPFAGAQVHRAQHRQPPCGADWQGKGGVAAQLYAASTVALSFLLFGLRQLQAVDHLLFFLSASPAMLC